MPLPIRISEIRKARGLTQQELADIVGASKPHISGVENGKKNLNNHLLEKIADALGVEPYELIVPPEKDALFKLAAELQKLQGEQLDQALERAQRLSAEG